MKRSRFHAAPAVAAFAIAVAACTPTTEAGRNILDDPVDCATAEDDLRILAEERKRVEEERLAGATAVTPGGAVIGIVAGTEEANLQVLSGEYEERIDAKIEEIGTTCGVEATDAGDEKPPSAN